MTVPLSILDLVSISEGATAQEAIAASMSAAKLAEQLGYKRLWFAEHHNTENLAASATALLIARAAMETSTIRLGSGGVMLPNHAPLMVAEQYGTLANMFGERIDLGLGRAPGTDGLTARALMRSSGEPQEFARNIYDLQGWFGSEGKGHTLPVSASVAAGMQVPIWVLGSTVSGASIAGQLGLPFAIASHFAPEQLDQAISVYRDSFSTESPTARLEEPYVMAGINVLVAESDEQAQREFTTTLQMFQAVATGKREKLQPPVTMDASPAMASHPMLKINAVGSPSSVRKDLDAFVARTGADELITVTYTYDPAVRERSLELLAELWF